MLSIHILNVGQGDSIVLEYLGDDGPAYGVIDSNCCAGQRPAALVKLQTLGAKKLSFVALSHPHADHYKGLLEILQNYQGNIDSFYSWPLDHSSEGRLKKLVKIYEEVYLKIDGKTARSALKEFVQILIEVRNYIGLENWEEHTGIENVVAPIGFSGVNIHSIQPRKAMKGQYFQLIESGDTDVVEGVNINSLSTAYKISYKNHEIILGGDVTYASWMEHKRQNARRNVELEANVAKLPHHGAKNDCNQDVLEYIFSATEDDLIACISAKGSDSHPHKNTLLELQKQNIKPYCTNLSVSCGADLKKILFIDPSIRPELQLFLNRVLEESPGQSYQPCQGNISIIIDDAGVLNVETEHDLPCLYRGGYDLFPASI